MLWHSTSPCTEVSADGRFTILWHQAGFGIWVARAYVTETMTPIGESVDDDREDAGVKAREVCRRFAWGWLA